MEAALKRTLPMGRIEIQALPGCDGLRLGLIAPDFPLGPLPAETMQAVIAQPAYWAFCWGSGLALACFLRAEPHWVAGKSVADLGSGSGVVAIAAAMAGAARVLAIDTDPDARLATEVNAAINGVTIDVRATTPLSTDLVLMADVLYDRSNLELLSLAQNRAHEVLLADTRIRALPDSSYREIARMDARTLPNLGEFDEFKTAHLFHWQHAAGRH